MIDFNPHPCLRSGHAQTIAGVFLPSSHEPYAAERHILSLDDGDQIVLHEDRPPVDVPVTCAVLLVHGLGGCHQSHYMRRLSRKLRHEGMQVWRMDLRGCGAGEGLARWGTHCGQWPDIAMAIDFITQQNKELPLHLVGFSMGGSLALHVAADMGGTFRGNLASLLAICPPIDLHSVKARFEQRIGRAYDWHFLKGLWKQFNRRAARVYGAPLATIARPRRLKDFDEHVTAPLGGYESADDYYNRTSVGPRLDQIILPTRIIAAADDPIIPLAPLTMYAAGTALDVHITAHGGHLGYIAGKTTDPDRRWLDWRVLEWVQENQQRVKGRVIEPQLAAEIIPSQVVQS